MQRSTVSPIWYRVAPVALLTGCLVTFNDYPQGDIGFAKAGASSASGAGFGVGGSSGVGATSGSSSGSDTGAVAGSGGSAGSTNPIGGTEAGGTLPIDVGGTTSEAGAGADASQGGAPVSEGDPYSIDDFEDGDELIFERQGRKGAWFVQNDGRGTQTPEAGAKTLPSAFMVSRSGSERGMHTSGGPFQTWGALLGTTLAEQSGQATPYDLSAYQGIKLWVRSNSTSPSAAKQVRLNLVTPTTMGSGCAGCGDHWGFDVPLTSKWVQVDVPFAELEQDGFGGPGPRPTTPDLKSVTSLHFLFPQGVAFDLWLDDIALY